jgi:DNA-binding response OmpR family regulator
MESKPRILIIDDDPAIRNILLANLRKDYDVAAVGSVLEALEIIEKGFIPQVALVDFMMPGLNGDQFIQNMPVPNCVPVLITAKRIDSEFIKDMLEKGALYILHKPFSMIELKAIVARIISDLEVDHGQDSGS